MKQDLYYVNLWLEVSKLIRDPEQVFVYMHVNNIGYGNPYFYK